MLRSAVAAADMCVHAGAHARNYGKRRAFAGETASQEARGVVTRRAPGKGKSSVSIFFSCRLTRGERPERHAVVGREERHARDVDDENIYILYKVDVILQCYTQFGRRVSRIVARFVLFSRLHTAREDVVNWKKNRERLWKIAAIK